MKEKDCGMTMPHGEVLSLSLPDKYTCPLALKIIIIILVKQIKTKKLFFKRDS